MILLTVVVYLIGTIWSFANSWLERGDNPDSLVPLSLLFWLLSSIIAALMINEHINYNTPDHLLGLIKDMIYYGYSINLLLSRKLLKITYKITKVRFLRIIQLIGGKQLGN